VLAPLFFTQVRWPWDRPLQAVCSVKRYGDPYMIQGDGRVVQARHRAPDPGCDCGIYTVLDPVSYFTAEQPRFSTWSADLVSGRLVVGTVELAGRVIPHQYGYRSEYARPVALHRPPTVSARVHEVVAQLAAAYGVPVVDPPAPGGEPDGT